MNNEISILPIDNTYRDQILDLILPIQQIEFNVPVTMDDQPDLLDIELHYYGTGGGFLGAVLNGELLGTIALINAGHQSGAIRKMFVRKDYRGNEKGVAQALLIELISLSKSKGIETLYLGTVDMLKAAHRFYEKNGFQRVKSEDMPSYFPRMNGENVYYKKSLSDTQI